MRLELIEHLFGLLYEQRRVLGHDEAAWPHRIMAGRRVARVEDGPGSAARPRLRLHLAPTVPPAAGGDATAEGGADGGEAAEVLDVDLVVAATGYRHTAHVDMLRGAWGLLPAEGASRPLEPQGRDRWVVQMQGEEGGPERRVLEVGRDYAVRFAPGTVAPGSGIWLQGCCEGTHGVSLSSLSSSFFSSSAACVRVCVCPRAFVRHG